MSKPTDGHERRDAESGRIESQPPPFVHRIRVRWGDCDPAAIAYTPRIPAWALEAIEAWWEHHAGIDWYHINIDRDLGTPFVRMSLDFRSPVTPRHILECEVVLTRLGSCAVTHRVCGRQNGVLCFDGEFVAVFVHSKMMVPRTPPEDILAAIRPMAPEAD
jgi:4-hydroxybenzoyl-CoA thioesterase